MNDPTIILDFNFRNCNYSFLLTCESFQFQVVGRLVRHLILLVNICAPPAERSRSVGTAGRQSKERQ